MGKFVEIKKINIPEIPDEVRGPRDLSFRPLLGGRMEALGGPLSSGDRFFFDPPPDEKMKIVPDLKNNVGMQFVERDPPREAEFKPFVLEGSSLIFGEKKAPAIVSDPELAKLNRELENSVSLVPALLGPSIPEEVAPLPGPVSLWSRVVNKTFRFLSNFLKAAFQEPPFWFGGPMMIFMGLLGRASRQTGNNLIPIGEGTAHNGQRLPVYDWGEYIAEKDRLYGISETTRSSFEGYVRNGDFQFYVNEILVRGASIRIDATAVTRIEGKSLQAHDFPDSPETIKAYFVSAGFSTGERVTFAIATPERKVVREIFKAFFEKYEELGSPRAALQWLLDSGWSHLVQI